MKIENIIGTILIILGLGLILFTAVSPLIGGTCSGDCGLGIILVAIMVFPIIITGILFFFSIIGASIPLIGEVILITVYATETFLKYGINNPGAWILFIYGLLVIGILYTISEKMTKIKK